MGYLNMQTTTQQVDLAARSSYNCFHYRLGVGNDRFETEIAFFFPVLLQSTVP